MRVKEKNRQDVLSAGGGFDGLNRMDGKAFFIDPRITGGVKLRLTVKLNRVHATDNEPFEITARHPTTGLRMSQVV